MSQTEIEEIVSEFRKSVYDISDEDAAEVVNLCIQKIKLIGQPESYMKLLLPDELKNYVFRRVVNVATLLRKIERSRSACELA